MSVRAKGVTMQGSQHILGQCIELGVSSGGCQLVLGQGVSHLRCPFNTEEGWNFFTHVIISLGFI